MTTGLVLLPTDLTPLGSNIQLCGLRGHNRELLATLLSFPSAAAGPNHPVYPQTTKMGTMISLADG